MNKPLLILFTFIFFNIFFSYFALQTLCSKYCLVSSQRPSSYRCHPDCKSSWNFKFLSYLIFLPFYDVSLVFHLSCLSYKFNSPFEWINFLRLIGCYRNHRHLDAKSLKATFLEANYLCKLKVPAQTTKREAQAMNFKDFILSRGHFSIEAIQTS